MAPPSDQMQVMKAARNWATFDSSKLTNIIFGSEGIVRLRNEAFERVETALGTNDLSKLPSSYGNTTREKSLLEGLEAGKVTLQDGFEYGHDFFDYNTHRYSLGDASPFGANSLMFIPSLKLQATREQLAYWLPLAESGKIIGTYCETELAHGTLGRGIETTATLDTRNDEFVLNSPTPTSTKFWAGGLGHCCSHAIVTARLIIKQKDYGVHPFMVQLRSLHDYTLMPGIELGDIGHTMAHNGSCSGFALFDHTRIPRTNLLMQNATVDCDGVYQKSPVREKLADGPMMHTRTHIIRNCAFQLAQAITIAQRYSTVREQAVDSSGLATSECSIADYKSQHFRLLTLISKAYANLFAWKSCNSAYFDMRNRQAKRDFSTLNYTQALITGLKAWSSQTAADGAEDARKCCGAQGFLLTSGLPDIVASVTATATFAGDNYVLWQQVARYLMECVAKLRNQGDVEQDMEYLAFTFRKERKQLKNGPIKCKATGTDFLRQEVLLDIFRHRATRLIFAAYDLLHSAETVQKLSSAEAWNAHMLPLIAAARAHIEVYILTAFTGHISGVSYPEVSSVLSNLVGLHALSSITSSSATDAISFIEDGYLSLSQINDIRAQVNILLGDLLPEAVALTDAWNFTDASLCSAIGCKDGDAYRRLMNWTAQLPINTETKKTGGVFVGGFETSIKPVLKGGWEMDIDEEYDWDRPRLGTRIGC